MGFKLIALFGLVILLPSSSNAQVSGISKFLSFLFSNLFQLTKDVAISKHNGASFVNGAVKQIGFVPKNASLLPNVFNIESAFVNANPKQFFSAALNPKYDAAPKCVEFLTFTADIPVFSDNFIALSIATAPTWCPNEWSASILEVDTPVSKILISGFLFILPDLIARQ